MRTFILICLIILSNTDNSFSQLPQDYPFKVIIDDEGFVYLTGEFETDIKTIKFDRQLNLLWETRLYNPGFDRGMDIAVEESTSPCVTGFVSNHLSIGYDIIVIKYSDIFPFDTLWTARFGIANRNDQAFGIATDDDGNIYVAGYVSNKLNKKDIQILKYSASGTLLNQALYDNPNYKGDDVAVDIVLDRSYAYVVGSTYQGKINRNDVILLNFNKDDLVLSSHQIYPKAYTNEIATGYTLMNASRTTFQKSHSALSSVSDNSASGGLTRENSNYLTLFFNNDENTTLRWAREFNGTGNKTDVPTSIDVSNFHVYVTGYSYRSSSNQYDFATIKYDTANGSYGWNGPDSIRYYDTLSGIDKGSSIKVKNNDTVYIAGTSSQAPNGFKIAKYKQSNPQIWASDWNKIFHPSFTQIDHYAQMQSAALIELDSLGNIYLITYAWNETEKYYAIRKYDSQGNELFTLDENQFDRLDHSDLVNKYKTKFNLSQNFPNPFNPVTSINFSIPVDAHIQLKIYDMSGREVADLLNEFKTAGNHKIDFDASDLASGVYYYKLIAGDYRYIRKMIVLK